MNALRNGRWWDLSGGWRLMFFFGAILWLPEIAHAQRPGGSLRESERPPKDRPPSETTMIDMELLVGDGAAVLEGHQWRKTLDELNVSLRVRTRTSVDKIGVKETSLGTLRKITITAELTRSGAIRTEGHEFTAANVAALREWLDELRTYGAQGSPEGKVLWGLTEQQFNGLYQEVAKPLGIELAGKEILEGTNAIRLGGGYSIRWSEAARTRLASLSPDDRKPIQPVQRFTMATGLAMSLRELGFAIRPQRTPAGSLEMSIEPFNTKGTFWPIGWPAKSAAQRSSSEYSALRPISVDSQPFGEVLPKVVEQAKLPLYVDRLRVRELKLDLEKKVKLPAKQTNWSIALRSLAFQAGLSRELVQDEAGTLFLWLTPIRDAAGKAVDPK